MERDKDRTYPLARAAAWALLAVTLAGAGTAAASLVRPDKVENIGNLTPAETSFLAVGFKGLKDRAGALDAELHRLQAELLAFEAAFAEAYVFDEVPDAGPPPADDKEAPNVPAGGGVVWPDPTTFGVSDMNPLIVWTFQPIAGAGCPDGVRWLQSGPFDGKKAVGLFPVTHRRFFFVNPDPLASTDRGLLSGVSGPNGGVSFRDGAVHGARKWGANGYVGGASFENITFYHTSVEHDVYVKLNGGGAGLSCRNLRSVSPDSQALQVGKREWEADDFGPGGPVVVWSWYAEDHGGGERESQAFKVFSAQAGTQKDQEWVQLPHCVEMGDLWLDDSMQTSSMGALFVGDAIDFDVYSIHARGGHLEQEAVRIEAGDGPVEIGLQGWGMWYDSAEGGRGVHVLDLERPVKLHPGEGNVRIYGPSGEVLAHITEGWTSSTWAE